MSHFKIAAAQVASVRGNIDRNTSTHAEAIQAAAKHEVSVLVFPELSLTGYEPDLARELAMSATDSRLTPLRLLAQQHRIEVVVGAPLLSRTEKPALAAILLSANGSTRTYCKMHLGGNESDFFSAGDKPFSFTVEEYTTGIAICADAAKASHPQTYADAGAGIYAAGVFLNEEWYLTDVRRLADHAVRHRMLVLMANHAASVGTYTSVGKSAAWAPDGALLAQAEGPESALVIATSSRSGWIGEVVRI
jgi:predicted amidohydrolase